ncbi:MAG: aldo/keto reductase, partial [Gemmatimonadaceae bacterium]|nr:aldo/keto reductase [Gemmatimonadaceae bacterium]
DVYGYGHSEELIGQALGSQRDKIVIASKGGFLEHLGPQNFTPAFLRRALESSLTRLGTTYVDLYQLHSAKLDQVKAEGAVECLRDLMKEGKIRAMGISVRSPEDGLVAARDLGFQAIQVNFNLADQRALDVGLFEYCKANGVAIIARTPLCFGFLTGQVSETTQFDSRDHRSTRSAEQRALWVKASRLFGEVLDENETATRTQQALRFVLSYPEVSTAIPGMLELPHVRENTAAGDLGPLSEDKLRRLRKLFEEHEFYLRDYSPPPIPFSGAPTHIE